MIQPIPLNILAESVDGTLIGNSIDIDSVSIDSRETVSPDLFVAIRGERFDGHDYVETMAKRGCGAVMVESANDGLPVPQLMVRDTRLALGQVAKKNRQQFDGPVIGITGSSGKTTTKLILSSLLSMKAPTCATQGNLNNEIGVPLTLLALNAAHRFAVIEMGARKLGDIAYLGQFVEPDIAILLNAGSAHIEAFGSYENTVAAKGEIYSALKSDGLAVLNVDDPAHAVWQEAIGIKSVISVSSKGHAADITASNIRCRSEGSEFDLRIAQKSMSVFLSLPGRHNVDNALAAIAVANHLGLDGEQIIEGLRSLTSTAGRMRTLKSHHGSTLLDDSYNANPESMRAALDVLLLHQGPKIAVLGQMAELGDEAGTKHLELARQLKSRDLKSVYLVGPYAEEMVAELGASARAFVSNPQLIEALDNELQGDEVVLIKGSRVAHMEDVVSALGERKH